MTDQSCKKKHLIVRSIVQSLGKDTANTVLVVDGNDLWDDKVLYTKLDHTGGKASDLWVILWTNSHQ